MGQTLPEMAATTISPESDCAKEHLSPTNDGIGLAYNSVQNDGVGAETTLVYVEFQVDPEGELQSDGNEHDVGHGAVYPVEECASAM